MPIFFTENFSTRPKVSLGSLLEKDMRDYYARNGFDFLLAKINEAMAK